MEIVPYQQFYEFHFKAALKPADLAHLLNLLPLKFSFRAGAGDIYFDPERGPGLFSLHLKQYPSEEKPVSSSQANYYIRWAVQASAGNLPRMAVNLAYRLQVELEAQVWLLDGYGRALQIPNEQEGRELSA